MTITRRKLMRASFALLPWLPLNILIMTVWLRYFAPQQPYARMDSTGIHLIDRSTWLAEEFPHFILFVYFTRFAVVAFAIGLIVLVIGLFWRRSTEIQSASPQI